MRHRSQSTICDPMRHNIHSQKLPSLVPELPDSFIEHGHPVIN
ncbi:hypothetical protein PSEEN1944 [Pseudomonas entomophila L48]|uniref:Uncharacterized protein n=1 Tax=Pseudomonas entomophila (strain L48) TaxID=384676 RepID=Q1IC34_PSEE4|nr:hypothetical protein PSEEN1944 [Pseudomonas entomophila L48]